MKQRLRPGERATAKLKATHFIPMEAGRWRSSCGKNVSEQNLAFSRVPDQVTCRQCKLSAEFKRAQS